MGILPANSISTSAPSPKPDRSIDEATPDARRTNSLGHFGHGLQVRGVAHHVILNLDAVAAVHVARHAGDIQRLAAIVALNDRDHLRRHLAHIHWPTDPQEPS
jgi:hypothetical protein